MSLARAVGAPTVTVTEELDAAQRACWDALVLASPAADVTQLSGWARLRADAGYRALFVQAEDGGELRGAALVLVRRLPGLGRVGYVPYGPLVPEDDDAVRTALADALRQLTRRGVRSLFVQPPEGAEAMSELLAARGFRPSASDVAPAASLRIDLTRTEEELHRGLSRRLRGYLRKCEAGGVTVRLAAEDELPVVAELMRDTGRHQGFDPFGLDYLRAMHRELAPVGGLRCFLGEVDGRPVAVTAATGCGDSVRTRFGGFARSPETRQLSVPAAVDWSALLWAKENGYRWFDFNGVLPESVPVLAAERVDRDALPGPDRYKAAFGGELVRHPQAVERIGSPVVRAAYDVARRTDVGRPLVEWVKRRARSGPATA